MLRACLHSTVARAKIIVEIPDLEAARRDARAVRQDSIDRLDELLAQWTTAWSSVSGIVHYAENGLEACRIIVDILKSHRVKRGVKSKSIVSEEIHLNRALASAGIDAVESDLGEYIVQLAGELPSHITAPALHRSRASIGKLFTDKLGIPYSDDPVVLTKVARSVLRERFLQAEFGLAGANFLIAETGHILIVENEGNARLGLALPPLFIVITGIEKVIAYLTDAAPILQLLARSATGQRFTSYAHLLKPSRQGKDSPREMHIVLLDNGRRMALADAKLREMMLCLRCGACLNACPVYRSLGGHAYGSTYPGPMGSVLSNIIGDGFIRHNELSQISTLCGLCKEVCPVDIDIPRMLLEIRSRASKPPVHRVLAAGWKWTMQTPQRYEFAGRITRSLGQIIPTIERRFGLSRRAFRDRQPDED